MYRLAKYIPLRYGCIHFLEIDRVFVIVPYFCIINCNDMPPNNTGYFFFQIDVYNSTVYISCNKFLKIGYIVNRQSTNQSIYTSLEIKKTALVISVGIIEMTIVCCCARQWQASQTNKLKQCCHGILQYWICASIPVIKIDIYYVVLYHLLCAGDTTAGSHNTLRYRLWLHHSNITERSGHGQSLTNTWTVRHSSPCIIISLMILSKLKRINKTVLFLWCRIWLSDNCVSV